MWVIIITILIIFAVVFAFWRFIWAVSKPILVFIYQSIVNALRGTGITEQAAKAIISAIAILLILLVLICSC